MSKVRYERWECEKCGGRVNVKASSPYIPYCDDCDQERFLISVEMKPKKRFTSSSLKALYEGNHPGNRFFFERETMRYFGDTMRNYGVRKVYVVYKYEQATVPFEVWELYRIQPVRFGGTHSEFFSPKGHHLTGVRLHDPTSE